MGDRLDCHLCGFGGQVTGSPRTLRITKEELGNELIGTEIETEVAVTVVKDDEELFDDTLPLRPDTVEDSSCGEVERSLATAEIPD
jgi:hypothetical protein